MSDNTTAVLPQSAGYGVVLGIGFFFTFAMIGLTWMQNRYTNASTKSASEFASASHSVKPALIACGVVSAWTWAATLLQSSATAYKCGISGAWWYAGGATVQVLLFAQNAAKLKMNAPGAHTFVEVLRVRWGKAAHFLGLFFGMATNVVVSAMLIQGASATIHQLTDMPIYASHYLIPLTVTCYVLVGGMRSSLLADYLHTAVLMAIILTFLFTAYATSDKIGSPGKMYDLLREAAARAPVEGNKDGEYVTFLSKTGGIFGVINIIGNFATVFLDQAYWQRAVASRPVSAVKAFTWGGSAWLSIPFAFATVMGLSAVALRDQLPFELTAANVSAGLPAPAAAVALLGKTGGVLMLIILFLAVTSAASAELVAVGSMITYDIYVPFINPQATDKQLLRCDHFAVAGWGLVMGLLGTIFYNIGISMGWLYEFMGCLLGGGVPAVALGIMSSRANKWFCIGGAFFGLAVGISAWLATAKGLYGELTVTTTGDDYPMLAGNVGSLFTSLIISTIGWAFFPEHYTFEETRALHAHPDELPIPPKADSLNGEDKEKNESSPPAQLMSAAASMSEPTYDEDADPVKLKKAYRFAVWMSLILFVVLLILIPVPLTASGHIFPKASFYVWVIAGIIWVFYGTAVVVLLPLWESRKELGEICGSIWADVTGKGKETVTVA